MANQSLYTAASPYYETSVVNNQYLDVMTSRPIPAMLGDVLMTVSSVYEYRPDMLAYDLYDDARLWWVFAERNPNKLGPDPYFNFTAGLEIYIPTINTLKQYLGI